MRFQPRQQFVTITIQRRLVIVSLVAFIAEMVVMTIIARGNLHTISSRGIGIRMWLSQYRPPITTIGAWIPQRLHSEHRRSCGRYISRGGSDHDCGYRYRNSNPTVTPSKQWHDWMATTPSARCYSSRSSSSSPVASIQVEGKKDPEDMATEARNMALSICGDDLSVQSCSTFGGLRYFNTDIDNRFRILFVLGGPGKFDAFVAVVGITYRIFSHLVNKNCSKGSGKGTQSELMVQNYPVAHFSVGELLRNVPDDSPYKATIDAKLVAGQIVPVEISLSLLKAAMEATPSKHTLFLVDGFPRNYDNLSGWCRVMQTVSALESVLVYQCPFPVLQDRILERAKISGRSDDNIESVKKRFKTFESETVPVVQILRSVSENCPSDRQRWSVEDISGDRSLDDVWASTQQTLNRLIQYDVLTANAALLTAIEMGDTHTYEKLSDSLFFKDTDVVTVMKQQEGTGNQISDIHSAEIEIVTGRQVTVSYDRLFGDTTVREKRFWSHQGIAGWRNVHFVRAPTHT